MAFKVEILKVLPVRASGVNERRVTDFSEHAHCWVLVGTAIIEHLFVSAKAYLLPDKIVQR